MTRLLTAITLFFLSIGIYAQEKQVWACQMEEGSMLRWENNGWQLLRITPYNVLLTINAELTLKAENTGTAKHSYGGHVRNLTCSFNNFLNQYSCLNSIRSEHYLFDPDTEKLGYSSLTGALGNDDKRDDVGAATFNCTKF
ncbi:hypothetical protein N9X66_09150 [Gammaproteobacteria bacterium]|nr:hypothetical protein [Gammaproteobacteria bacterium]